jgi:hypothetical protein
MANKRSRLTELPKLEGSEGTDLTNFLEKAKLAELIDRLGRADPVLEKDCRLAGVTLIEEFPFHHFDAYMHRIVMKLNGDSETIPVPIGTNPWGDTELNIRERLPEELQVNGIRFTRSEVLALIRLAHWRLHTAVLNDPADPFWE